MSFGEQFFKIAKSTDFTFSTVIYYFFQMPPLPQKITLKPTYDGQVIKIPFNNTNNTILLNR